MISVIIPVHNAAGTLEGAVRSVLKQTFPDFELILVEDGGTDGSPILCDELAAEDDRIRVFHMENRGVSAARNLGLDAARGGKIAFLDADDVLHPSMLQVLSDLLDATGADYAGCEFEKRRDGQIPFEGVERGYAPETALSDNVKVTDLDTGDEGGKAASDGVEEGGAVKAAGDVIPACAAELRGQQIITEGVLHPTHPDTRVWSKLFCREYIGKVRFREGLTIGEDMLFLVELARPDARYVRIRDALYSYYINPNGAMERPFTPNHMDTIRCRDLAEEVIRERFPAIAKDSDGAARLAAQQLIAAVLTASKIARLPSKEQARFEKEFEVCRESIRRHYRTRGAAEYLPQGYSVKIQMLLHLPGVYRRLYR